MLLGCLLHTVTGLGVYWHRRLPPLGRAAFERALAVGSVAAYVFEAAPITIEIVSLLAVVAPPVGQLPVGLADARVVIPVGDGQQLDTTPHRDLRERL